MSQNNGVQHKTHMDVLLPKPHIRKSDIKGEYIVLEIRKHGLVEVYDRKEKDKALRGILYFKGTEKYLIMNATRVQEVADALGSEYIEDWIGKKIALYVAAIKTNWGMEKAIRVKEAPKPMSQQADPVTGEVAPQTAKVDVRPDTQQAGGGGEEAEQEKAPMTKQQYFNKAYGEMKINDTELAQSIADELAPDYDKAMEKLIIATTPPEDF